MTNTAVSVIIYIIAAVLCVYLGISLRKWRDRTTQTKLIKDVEAVLKEPVPKYKKAQHAEQINWDRVYNALKKLPQDEKIQQLMKRVDEQVRQYYKNKARK